MHLKKYEWVGSPDLGDCSLWVRSAALEFDDGYWQCQVTASDFTTQDALASEPAKLVVRGNLCYADFTLEIQFSRYYTKTNLPFFLQRSNSLQTISPRCFNELQQHEELIESGQTFFVDELS